MVLCKLASPWWYAVSADTKPDSCATCAPEYTMHQRHANLDITIGKALDSICRW